MSERSRPSLAEIKGWESDRVTQYLFKLLQHKFPNYKSLLPILSSEQAYRLNHRVGTQDVLEAIAKFCEDGEI